VAGRADAAPAAASTYDGVDAGELARRCGVPRAAVLGETTSTLDVAHALAEAGSPGGTRVVADRQTAGRGRQGRSWTSAAGSGIWLTLVERAVDPAALPVLSIRLGLAAAPVLDQFTESPTRLKWPNDVYVAGAKLAGILCEGRWRGGALEWVAVGLGVNVVPPPDVPTAAGMRRGVQRVAVLERLAPALRGAVGRRGLLDGAELAAYEARDLARGQHCREPLPGVVEGLAADGALRVRTAQGIAAAHSGSLVIVNGPA
jgi:BirA family biotin operon repressor/biotin-[acetyl-CoA-carboxylase] ligase